MRFACQTRYDTKFWLRRSYLGDVAVAHRPPHMVGRCTKGSLVCALIPRGATTLELRVLRSATAPLTDLTVQSSPGLPSGLKSFYCILLLPKYYKFSATTVSRHSVSYDVGSFYAVHITGDVKVLEHTLLRDGLHQKTPDSSAPRVRAQLETSSESFLPSWNHACPGIPNNWRNAKLLQSESGRWFNGP